MVGQFLPNSRKLYNTLVMLLYCMDVISLHHSWRARLKVLIAAHAVPVNAMGFPHDWVERQIWYE